MVDQEKKSKKQLQNDPGAARAKRLLSLQAKLKADSLDAFIVSLSPNKYYLTGWEADPESGWVIVTNDKSYVLTDFRYSEHATLHTKNFEIIEYDTLLPRFFGEFSKKKGFSRVGFESHALSVHNFKKLRRFSKHLKLVPTTHFVEDLRSTKDDLEIVKLKKAVEIADKAFNHVLNFVKVNMTEVEVAWEMEKFMRGEGATRMAWSPFIVATGPNSSMAHWGASNRKIQKGDMVLIDYGCVYDGYYSDTTRVIFIGKPTDEQKKVYNRVLDAQKLGEGLVKDGKLASIIDKKVRAFLEKYNKYYYRHSLGHGVGLEVHELPRLSTHSKNKLQTGNVVTVEPGVYVPNWGGVRLEDMVVVKDDSCEILTKAPKNIKEVTV